MDPPFLLYFQNVLRFCFENRFIKCSLILSSGTLTLLYFASRKRPQCCMLHVLKSEAFIREEGEWGGGGGEGGGLGPLFLDFLNPPLYNAYSFQHFLQNLHKVVKVAFLRLLLNIFLYNKAINLHELNQ